MVDLAARERVDLVVCGPEAALAAGLGDAFARAGVRFFGPLAAAAAIALQIVLPSVWSGFQIVGGDTSVTSPTGATNAVLLGAILIVFTTLVNAAGVRVMARINVSK